MTEPAQRLENLSIPRLLAIDPAEMQDNWMPNPWILPLFQSLQAGCLRAGENHQFSLAANQFFPGCGAPDYIVQCHNYNPVQCVEAAVMLWLQFRPQPRMTLPDSRALATFILVVWKAFHSSSFLYLDYVQYTLKNLKMDETSPDWEGLTQELKNHPLTSPTSNESLVLEHLKDFLWAVSTLPLPKPTAMSTAYQKAVEVGGDAGAQIFALFVGQVYVSL